jgi:hypothetical protein
LFTFVLPAVALAHSGGTSYVEIDRARGGLMAQIDLPLPELAAELDLDADHDGALRWGEVLDAAPKIAAVMERRLQLKAAHRRCASGSVVPPQLAQRDTGRHLRIALSFDCGGTQPDVIDAAQWLAEVPDHGIYVSAAGAPQRLALLAGSLNRVDLAQLQSSPSGAQRVASLLRFLKLGVLHLLSGYDHIAFLALLLLGTLRGAARDAGPRGVFVGAAKVVTAFTAAHSVTLALAASGIVRLPVAPVEAAIAGSILITAALLFHSSLRNSITVRRGWPLAFAFGLVHGLGFANVLAEVLSGVALAGPLLAFNLGIELAQLGLVLAALPLLWWLGGRPQLARLATPALALGIGVLSAVWLTERWP